jgi:hypothetical protein
MRTVVGARRFVVVGTLALGLAAPFVLGASAARRLAGAAGERAGRDAAALLSRAEPLLAPIEPAAPMLEPEALQEAAAAAPVEPAASSSGPPPAPLGVLVRRARVLRAARAGLRPSGVPVPATEWRPAGLALVGVSGVGAGVRDGDVLTRVGGTPARSVGAVRGAVVAALRAGAPAVSGELWRDRQRLVVTVELPRLAEARRDAY